MTAPAQAWLAKVRHDLIKRLLWPARDRRDLGGPVIPGELRATLVDDEGRPVTATALWETLAAEAPQSLAARARLDFAQAVAAAERAAVADDLAAVLALEAAFDALARAVKGKGDDA
jgi:hypothetical protein